MIDEIANQVFQVTAFVGEQYEIHEARDSWHGANGANRVKCWSWKVTCHVHKSRAQFDGISVISYIVKAIQKRLKTSLEMSKKSDNLHHSFPSLKLHSQSKKYMGKDQ